MDLENISAGRIYDVTNCDREPIHIPGAIQPHGFLLAIREPELTLEQCGENLGAFLEKPAASLLGSKLEELFTPETMQEIQGALCLPDVRSNNPLNAQFIGRPETFTTTLHRHGETMILELEKATEADGAKRLDRYHRTRQAISKLRAARSLDELCATACEQVRALTGLDRVVVYFFDRDWNGAVISESRSEGTESFMGLHFPASDIPRQARALYSQNWLRLIPNVEYEASPIVPALNPRTGAPLDLSFSILRSVSPLHIEYLKNMGLTASMSVSLMKGDQLWGLISCAALNGPRYISFETRAACEFIGEVVSSLLAEKSQLESYDARLNTRGLLDHLVSAMTKNEDFVAALFTNQEQLLALTGAGGAAISFRGDVALIGATPKLPAVRRLIAWLTNLGGADSFETESLRRDYPDWEELGPAGCGLLAISLSKTSPGQFVCWFRPEVTQTVKWGGNPNKAPSEDGMRLHPRKSFALWQETLRGQSLPWRREDIEAAQGLQRSVNEVVLGRAERLEQLIEELRRSNFELDSFAYAASHDLKEPVRGIHNYADFLRRETGLSEKGRERLETIYRLTERMDGLLNSLLEYSQVGRTDLALEELNFNDLAAQAQEMVKSALQDRGAKVTVGEGFPRVLGDKVRVVQILTNLLSNAAKYNEKSPEIFVGAEAANGGAPIFFVKDNGIGIPLDQHETVFRIFKRLHGKDEFGGGSGTGLTIAKAIVERHGGEMWFESRPGEGTTFYFTLQRRNP